MQSRFEEWCTLFDSVSMTINDTTQYEMYFLGLTPRCCFLMNYIANNVLCKFSNAFSRYQHI